ncbi:MAG: ankyrin repeat domain-containing protein [Candidatus Amoebophilus sp.]
MGKQLSAIGISLTDARDIDPNSLVYKSIQSLQKPYNQVIKLLIEKGASIKSLKGCSSAKGLFKYMNPLCLAIKYGNIEIAKELLTRGANINLADSKCQLPLHTAAKRGDLQIFNLLIAYGADKNALDYNGNTLLHTAVKGGNLELILRLLDEGFKIDVCSKKKMTPLELAAKKGNLEVFTLLQERQIPKLDRGIFNTSSLSEKPLLHFAAEGGNVALVKLLLHQGASIRDRDDSGETPFHIAAREGHLEVIKLLLQKEQQGQQETNPFTGDQGLPPLTSDQGLPPFMGDHALSFLFTGGNGLPPFLDNYVSLSLMNDRGLPSSLKNKLGEVPLHIAVRKGYVEIVRLLLEYGVDVNTKSSISQRPKTPLYIAAGKGHVEIVKLLLKHGANINDMNQVPLYAAAKKGHTEIVRLLLEHGADVNGMYHPFNEDDPPLYIAVEKGHIEVVKLLLQQGAKLKPVHAGDSLLHLAAEVGNRELLELVISKEMESVPLEQQAIELDNLINARGSDERTPLHILARHLELEEPIRFLIEQGADVNAKDAYGYIPLHYALGDVPNNIDNNFKVVWLLLEKGADPNAISNNGETPLGLYIDQRDLRWYDGIAELLIDKGADISEVDEDGNTLLYRAFRARKLDIVKVLLEKGVKMNPNISSQGGLPCMICYYEEAEYDKHPGYMFKVHNTEMFNRHLELLNLALAQGIDINDRDAEGNSLLHIVALEYGRLDKGGEAVINRLLDLAKMLIARGVDVNAANEEGNYPLHLAAASRTPHLVKLLVELGAKIDVRNNDDETPLDVASRQGKEEIIGILDRNNL